MYLPNQLGNFCSERRDCATSINRGWDDAATDAGYRHSEKVAMIMITHCPAINLCALCFFSTIYQKPSLCPLHTLCVLCNINKQVKRSRYVCVLFNFSHNFRTLYANVDIPVNTIFIEATLQVMQSLSTYNKKRTIITTRDPM